MIGGLPRAAIVASLLAILGAYLLMWRPLETAIADRFAQLDDARALLARSAALSRDTDRLVREKRRGERAIDLVHLRDSRAVLVDRFLHALAAVSARDEVVVENVTSAAAMPAVADTVPRAASLFDEVPFEVTLRGGYGAIIRAVRDLNAADFAARIALDALRSVAQATRVRPQVEASFHCTLLRGTDESTTVSHPG